MTRLAPAHMASFIMGAWFYMMAGGNFVAGKIGEATGGKSGVMSKAATLMIYDKIGWGTIVIGGVVLALAPFVRRWMHLDTLVDRISPADQAKVWGGDGERENADVGLPARG